LAVRPCDAWDEFRLCTQAETAQHALSTAQQLWRSGQRHTVEFFCVQAFNIIRARIIPVAENSIRTSTAQLVHFIGHLLPVAARFTLWLRNGLCKVHEQFLDERVVTSGASVDDLIANNTHKFKIHLRRSTN